MVIFGSTPAVFILTLSPSGRQCHVCSEVGINNTTLLRKGILL
nr:MAG TPA: hypothetical protein [Caudoviricetes sp.]